jgi:hypothetical protein
MQPVQRSLLLVAFAYRFVHMYCLQTVGYPYTTGAWYDATLAFSHRDKIAHCTFQLRGTKGVTDVAVKAGRQPGYKSNVLYNILGPGTWQVVSCQAMVPGEGGLVQARSLLPEHRQELQQGRAGHAAAAAAGCQPCQQQQQQQQASGSWWRRLWRRQAQQQQPATKEN